MRPNEFEKTHRNQYNDIKCSEELFKKLYRVYNNMKSRCYNKNFPKYKSYGARGIVVCDEWKNDRHAFLKWAVDNCHSLDLTLDRIDVNGNYEPENCQWITMEDQAKNKQNTIKVVYYGQEYCLRDLCMRVLGYTHREYQQVFVRIAYDNWDPIKAIETPIKHPTKRKSKLQASYTYKGVTKSLRQLCKHFNMYYETIKYRVLQQGMNVVDAMNKGTDKPFTYVNRRSKLGGDKIDL